MLVSEKSFNHLARNLSLADLVKFAKYKPLPDEDNLTLANTYFFVNETKKEKLNKPETPAENDKSKEDEIN